MHEIIRQLKAARQEKGLTQAELGRKLGLPQSHISKIEQGATDPRLSTLADMARLLDLELLLVPRAVLSAVVALMSGDEQGPMWSPDDEDEP